METLISSLKPIGNIVLICCAFFIIFGILGVQVRGVQAGQAVGRLRGQRRGSSFLSSSLDLVPAHLGPRGSGGAVMSLPAVSAQSWEADRHGPNGWVQNRLGKWLHRGPSYIGTWGWARDNGRSTLKEMAFAVDLEGEVILTGHSGGRCVRRARARVWR